MVRLDMLACGVFQLYPKHIASQFSGLESRVPDDLFARLTTRVSVTSALPIVADMGGCIAPLQVKCDSLLRSHFGQHTN